MVTYIIIGITVLTSLLSFNNEKLLSAFIFNPFVIQSRNQYYRFITSGFIHADLFHLGFNMMTLYFFGTGVEYLFSKVIFSGFGEVMYIALYISGLIMSSTFSYYKNKENPRYNALGASGAISAVLFCSVVLLPNSGIGIFPFSLFFPNGMMPAYIFGPLYLVYCVYMSRRGMDNIGHEAHFFGALWGVLFILILWHDALRNFISQLPFLN